MNEMKIDFKTILSECEIFKHKLKSHRIELNNGSRFSRFNNEAKIVFQNEDIILIEKIIHSKEFYEGFRDYLEFRYILNSENIYNNAFNDLIKIFGGNRLSYNDDSDNTARNFQYQLYLGAFFEKNGLSVRHKEPDLIINYKGKEISVAVKRVNSKNKIIERIRNGEKQIIKSGTNGIIAISLDKIINKDEFSIEEESSNQLFEKTERKLMSFLSDNHTDTWFNRKDEVIAIIFTLTTPHKIKNELSFGCTTSAIAVPIESANDIKYNFMNSFMKIAFPDP